MNLKKMKLLVNEPITECYVNMSVDIGLDAMCIAYIPIFWQLCFQKERDQL